MDINEKKGVIERWGIEPTTAYFWFGFFNGIGLLLCILAFWNLVLK